MVDALRAFVDEASDEALAGISPLEFAATHGLDEKSTIDAFVHAARLGLFDMAWNICCPGCGGVLDAGTQLKAFVKNEYPCAMCSASYEPTLDELVAVTFSVSPSLRKIASHNPNRLSFWEFYRQTYFGPGMALPTGKEWEGLIRSFTLEEEVLAPGERVVLSLRLPAEFLILFEPVTHSATFFDVKGDETRDRQDLVVVFSESGAHHDTIQLRPGPLRLTLENKTDRRLLPGLFRANDQLHTMMRRRRSVLTATRLLSNHVFRTLYKTPHAGCRPAPEDRQPHGIVHRSEGVVGALRAGG